MTVTRSPRRGQFRIYLEETFSETTWPRVEVEGSRRTVFRMSSTLASICVTSKAAWPLWIGLLLNLSSVQTESETSPESSDFRASQGISVWGSGDVQTSLQDRLRLRLPSFLLPNEAMHLTLVLPAVLFSLRADVKRAISECAIDWNLYSVARWVQVCRRLQIAPKNRVLWHARQRYKAQIRDQSAAGRKQ